MKVQQAYAPTSSHSDVLVESFYEGVEWAMSKENTLYTILIDNLNAKAGKTQAEDLAVEKYGISTGSAKGSD